MRKIRSGIFRRVKSRARRLLGRYEPEANIHSDIGALAAARHLFGTSGYRSLIDFGIGTGAWLRAASSLGVSDLCGVDLEPLQEEALPAGCRFVRADLRRPFDLRRKFDVALCLEVAEHLPRDAGPVLIRSLTRHADVIIFSAAVPRQGGQGHVNCQWPEYWQRLFNSEGYACDDQVRWSIWALDETEPWYRQNIFVAKRDARAGSEPRILPVLHPEMLEHLRP